MTRPAANLAWTQDPELMAAWDAAVVAVQHVAIAGDLGADHGPSEPVTADSDGDWLADREDDRRWRQWP